MITDTLHICIDDIAKKITAYEEALKLHDRDKIEKALNDVVTAFFALSVDAAALALVVFPAESLEHDIEFYTHLISSIQLQVQRNRPPIREAIPSTLH